MNKKGAIKYDGDKPNMALLPFVCLYEVAKVLAFGAEKYAPWGWTEIPNGEERCTSALLRHYTEIQKGNLYDEESGLLHSSHIACNALFILYFHLKRTKS